MYPSNVRCERSFACYHRSDYHMARWLSWLERRPVTAEVVGSNPIRVVAVFSKFYGVLAQLGEHLPYKQRVIGSSPIGPIKYGEIAQLARAHGSYPWCRGFKSPSRYYTKYCRSCVSAVFLLYRIKGPKVFHPLMASSCGFRPFDPGIILTFHMGSFLQTGQYNKWLLLQLMLLYDNGRHG